MTRTKEKKKGLISDDDKIDAYEMLTFSAVYSLTYHLLESGQATENTVLNLILSLLKLPTMIIKDFTDPLGPDLKGPQHDYKPYGEPSFGQTPLPEHVIDPNPYGEPTPESKVILPDGKEIERRDLHKYTKAQLTKMINDANMEIAQMAKEMAKSTHPSFKKVWKERIKTKKAIIQYYISLLEEMKK